MADTTATHVLIDGAKRRIVHCLHIYDDTGESAAVKVDLSGLTLFDGTVPGRLAVLAASWNVFGYDHVRLQFDRDPAVDVLLLAGQGCLDFGKLGAGALIDPGSGGTGDLVLTTGTPAASGASGYQITLDVALHRG